MKLLAISDNCGHFLGEGGALSPIDQITKDDLLRLVELTLENEVVFDEYDEALLKNQAHQIIYKSVFGKLSDLRERKQEFTDQSERLFLSAYEKYRDQTGGSGAVAEEGDSGSPEE